MVMITLYAKQKKRHRCTEQTFGLCGRRQGWDVSREQHCSLKYITCILSMVKQITSPGWVHETSAQGWCTGKTQRDQVERELGGGIGMGNTCKSKADSCQCMTKTTTIKKKVRPFLPSISLKILKNTYVKVKVVIAFFVCLFTIYKHHFP